MILRLKVKQKREREKASNHQYTNSGQAQMNF